MIFILKYYQALYAWSRQFPVCLIIVISTSSNPNFCIDLKLVALILIYLKIGNSSKNSKRLSKNN